MKIQIDNQIIEITGNSTVITIVNKIKNFRHTLDFDFRKLPNEIAKIKSKDMAEYYWLSNLYNDFIKAKQGTQLSLFTVQPGQ